MRERASIKAFTLLETLVVVAIVSIIFALTIPAVLTVRETARRSQCQNNLKQIAMAVNSHLHQKGFYPRGENFCSPFVHMLPYLEQNTLYNSINLKSSNPIVGPSNDANRTAFATKVAVFVCPSDSVEVGNSGPITYAGNIGTGVGMEGGPDNGPLSGTLFGPEIRDSSVRDGLSNTVAVAEFCRTWGEKTPRLHHPVFEMGAYGPRQMDVLIADCMRLDVNRHQVAIYYRGQGWGRDAESDSAYDHNITPNGNTCHCNNGALWGVWTAGSSHSGGVNCAHLDGHANFVPDSVSLPVWRSLGTMNGGEVIDNKF